MWYDIYISVLNTLRKAIVSIPLYLDMKGQDSPAGPGSGSTNRKWVFSAECCCRNHVECAEF